MQMIILITIALIHMIKLHAGVATELKTTCKLCPGGLVDLRVTTPKTRLTQLQSQNNSKSAVDASISNGKIQYRNIEVPTNKWTSGKPCVTRITNDIVIVECRMWKLETMTMASSPLFETPLKLRLSYRRDGEKLSLALTDWFPYRYRFACTEHGIDQLQAAVTNDSAQLSWRESWNEQFQFAVSSRRVWIYVRGGVQKHDWRAVVPAYMLVPPLLSEHIGEYTVTDLRECTTYKACVETEYLTDEIPRKTFKTCTEQFSTLGEGCRYHSSMDVPNVVHVQPPYKIGFGMLGVVLVIICVLVIVQYRHRFKMDKKLQVIVSHIHVVSCNSLVSQRVVQLPVGSNKKMMDGVSLVVDGGPSCSHCSPKKTHSLMPENYPDVLEHAYEEVDEQDGEQRYQ